MDVIGSQAIESLTTVINTLLSGISPTPSVAIQPLKVSPTGLGGYLAPHQDPQGDRLGRRVEAQIWATISEGSPAARAAAVTAVNNQMLNMSRAEMLERGMLRVSAELDVPAPTQTNTFVLGYRVLFEFIKHPEEAGDVIREIPVNLAVG